MRSPIAEPPIAEPRIPGPPTPEPAENLGAKRPEILLGDRFVVRQALRYANKGGVFQAIDKRTGQDAVVKQARAHVGGDERGLDVRHLLANEAHVLSSLQPTGVTPRLLAFFQQGGDGFLAEEAVAGQTLRAWNATRWEDEVPAPGETLAMAQKVAAALAVVHQHGVIIRDFTPNNLIVQPDGNLRLIDLELAVTTDGVGAYQAHLDAGHRALTPAYGSPGQAAGLRPALSDDSFALGAILCFLFTGEDPYIDPDSPAAGTAHPVAAWLRSGVRAQLVPAPARQLALALTDPDPSQRPSAAGASIMLRRLEVGGVEDARPCRRQLDEATLSDLRSLPDASGDRLIKDALVAIRSSAQPGSERFWPATSFGATTDPRNVQHGVAGVMGALVQSWQCTGNHEILDLVASAATWLSVRANAMPFGPVGLHFGAAGQSWSLFEAGSALGDDHLIEEAVGLALRLPPDWPGPDITHGRAGLGLTLLHFYNRTGQDRFLTAAGRCADSLLRDVEPISDDVIGWRTPAGFRSSFAGRTFYGFAHGTAGIGTFLLEMAMASGREDCHAIASAAASSLVKCCTRRHDLIGWGEGPDKPAGLLPHWCNGASGIGSFLLRWWRASGDDSFVPVLEGAARTAMAAKWRSGVAYCHGLAGNGDFLLDAGDFLGDTQYHIWARDLATVLCDRRVVQDGLSTFGDQPGARTPDFSVGLAGVLSFFLRLRHGGPRLWMVDSGAAA